MRLKNQNLKFFERKTNEVCPRMRDPSRSITIESRKYDCKVPLGSLERSISMDKPLVLLSKQFKVVIQNHDD